MHPHPYPHTPTPRPILTCTHTPQYKKPEEHSWLRLIYGEHDEELLPNMPEPKGKAVRTTSFEDANLYHCHATGKAATGVIHMVQGTIVAWHTQRQGQVETATYGSEFTSAKTCTEQIMDLRYTLRMMGVPLDGPSWMFGDNESVVTSSTIPSSTLNKRVAALAYHRVREAIARKIIHFVHIPGKENPADVLTKYVSHAESWPLVEPMLFWKGDTLDKRMVEGSVSRDQPSGPSESPNAEPSEPSTKTCASSLNTNGTNEHTVVPYFTATGETVHHGGIDHYDKMHVAGDAGPSPPSY